MNPQEKQEFEKVKRDLQNLTDVFYRNNFSSRQDFYKTSDFKTGLKIPNFALVPTSVDEIGKVIEVAGIMYICTATTPTWTKVGTQT